MYNMQEWDACTRSRIRTHLERRVPALIRRYKRMGGPRGEDYARARSYALLLGEHGDDILFPNTKKGTDTEVMDMLVEAVAVLSFCPGGVSIFGLEYNATRVAVEGRDELQQLIADFDRTFSQTPRCRYVRTTMDEDDGVQHSHPVGEPPAP